MNRVHFLQINRHQKGIRKNICIIGAGISGLASAYELSRLGYGVVVLESTNRPGGRIRTYRFADGTHGELGPVRIPRGHHLVMHYITEFKLPVRNYVNYNPAAYYYLRGQKTRVGHYEQLFNKFNLLPTERQSPPRLLSRLMDSLLSPLSSHEKNQISSDRLTSPTLRMYDAQALSQFLRRHLSTEAYEFLGNGTSLIHLKDSSLLELIMLEMQLREEQHELVDGMDALVHAFMKRIPGTVEFHARAKQIRITESGVDVHWERSDGSVHCKNFDYVICTVPAFAVVRIEFVPPLPARQAQAFREVKYVSGAKTLIHTKERPWEFIDGIYGGGSYTDLPISQCWYPSDNSRPVFRNKESHSDSSSIYWTARNKELSHSPAVLNGAYQWGENARHFLSLTDEEKNVVLISGLRRLHPQIDKYINTIIYPVWDTHTSEAFALFAPEERTYYQQILRRPFPNNNPRVFFAGEHVSSYHTWIQGAIQSGVEASLRIIEQNNRAE